MSTDVPAYRLPGNYGQADPTPAPLDLAAISIKLKSGDHIEAESDGTKVGGKVSHVTERGFVVIEHLGEFAIHHITASPQADRYRWFVLTAHQPAPKKDPREQVMDILIDYSNNRADDYDTADRIMAALVPDETRPLPTREQVWDMVASHLPATAMSYQEELVDAVMALLRGESR